MAAAPRPLIREAYARDKSKSGQDRHHAYLALLQERNRNLRQIREQDRTRQVELEQRERGFSTHFSGANATRRRKPKDAPSSLNSMGVVGRSGLERGEKPSQWEVNTVEIKGEDGEVFAVRPGIDLRPLPETDMLEESGSGDMDRTMEATVKLKGSELGTSQRTQGTLADDCKDLAAELEALEQVNDWAESSNGSEAELDDKDSPETQVPEDVGEVLKATLTGTREELKDLRKALESQGILPEAEAEEADPPSTSLAEQEVEPEPAEAQSSHEQGGDRSLDLTCPAAAADATPATADDAAATASSGATAVAAATCPDAIAQRIAKLDSTWRGALLQLLDEAEAAAAAKAASTAPAAAAAAAAGS